MLQMIQNADPTGENNPDSVEMLQLEGMLHFLSVQLIQLRPSINRFPRKCIKISSPIFYIYFQYMDISYQD